MKITHKTFIVTYAVILGIISPIIVNATMLSRDVFEGPGTELDTTWVIDKTQTAVVSRFRESPDDYQTQAHGEKSLWLKDPNNNSYANAYKTFTNSSSEYMVEFYLWIYHNHETIDSFPLCVLWHVVLPETLYPDYRYKTDIALILDTVDVPPNGHPFKILVEDSIGIQFAAYIDSVDRWYKIQIYRHNGVVDFYLDGDSIGTYSPMNSNYVSNKIVLGTTAADSLSDGEVFYDNFIVVDYGDVNKITMMKKNVDQKEMLSFLSEVNEYLSKIQPYLIYRNYRYFSPADIFYVVSLSNLLNANFNYLSNYERLSYFNELVVKLDQIKLGLLYGNLNETEKNLIRRTFDFCIVDTKDNDAYNVITKKEQK